MSKVERETAKYRSDMNKKMSDLANWLDEVKEAVPREGFQKPDIAVLNSLNGVVNSYAMRNPNFRQDAQEEQILSDVPEDLGGEDIKEAEKDIEDPVSKMAQAEREEQTQEDIETILTNGYKEGKTPEELFKIGEEHGLSAEELEEIINRVTGVEKAEKDREKAMDDVENTAKSEKQANKEEAEKSVENGTSKEQAEAVEETKNATVDKEAARAKINIEEKYQRAMMDARGNLESLSEMMQFAKVEKEKMIRQGLDTKKEKASDLKESYKNRAAKEMDRATGKFNKAKNIFQRLRDEITKKDGKETPYENLTIVEKAKLAYLEAMFSHAATNYQDTFKKIKNELDIKVAGVDQQIAKLQEQYRQSEIREKKLLGLAMDIEKEENIIPGSVKDQIENSKKSADSKNMEERLRNQAIIDNQQDVEGSHLCSEKEMLAAICGAINKGKRVVDFDLDGHKYRVNVNEYMAMHDIIAEVKNFEAKETAYSNKFFNQSFEIRDQNEKPIVLSLDESKVKPKQKGCDKPGDKYMAPIPERDENGKPMYDKDTHQPIYRLDDNGNIQYQERECKPFVEVVAGGDGKSHYMTMSREAFITQLTAPDVRYYNFITNDMSQKQVSDLVAKYNLVPSCMPPTGKTITQEQSQTVGNSSSDSKKKTFTSRLGSTYRIGKEVVGQLNKMEQAMEARQAAVLG